jgi:hypothetical protein
MSFPAARNGSIIPSNPLSNDWMKIGPGAVSQKWVLPAFCGP